MSDQRKALARYKDKTARFKGRYQEYRRSGDHLELLLTWVYPVNKDGHKVPLRKDYVVAPNGERCAADHVWIDAFESPSMARQFAKGEEVEFTAVVKTYPIVRQDVLAKRDAVYDNYKTEEALMFKTYCQAQDELYDNYREESDRLYASRLTGTISFDEMKAGQEAAKKYFNDAKNRLKRSFAGKRQRRFDKAKKRQNDLELVDYELINCQYLGMAEPYDVDRLNDLSYVKYVIAVNADDGDA